MRISKNIKLIRCAISILLEDRKFNKRKLPKTKKIRQPEQQQIVMDAQASFKKEMSSIATSDITNATNMEKEILERFSNLYSKTTSETADRDNEHLIDPIDELLLTTMHTPGVHSSNEQDLKTPDEFDVINDLENMPDSDNAEQAEKTYERLTNKRKAAIQAPRKHIIVDAELPDQFSSEPALIGEYSSSSSSGKKSRNNTLDNIYYHTYGSPTSPLNSPGLPTTHNSAVNGTHEEHGQKPTSSISEINPTDFEQIEDYTPLDEFSDARSKRSDLYASKPRPDKRNSSFDSIEQLVVGNEFTNLVADNMGGSIELISTRLQRDQLNGAECSARSDCSVSSRGDRSPNNYGQSGQVYFDATGNYGSYNDAHAGNMNMGLNSMHYTDNLFDRMSKLESTLNSTISFSHRLISFTHDLVSQLDKARFEIKSLKNELVGMGNPSSSSAAAFDLNANSATSANCNASHQAAGVSSEMHSNQTLLLDDQEQQHQDHNLHESWENIGRYAADYSKIDEHSSYNYNNQEHQSSEHMNERMNE